MKTLILALALIVSSHVALAASTNPVAISREASKVLLSPAYAKLVKKLSTDAVQHGRAIQLATISTTQIGDQMIVSIDVQTRVAADIGSQFESIGEIVGMLSETSSGESSLDGLYFKAAPSGPGGASVGN